MKKTKHACNEKVCLMCRLCRKEWQPALQAHKQNFSLKKGELLFREDDPLTGIYFIHEGRVKVHKHWGPDKELIVRFAREGEIVGHRGMGAENIYPVSATALEPTVVCYYELDFFQASLKVNENLLYEMMMFYARELQVSERKMRNLAHMPVKGRIAAALLSLKQQFGRNEGGFINFNISKQDLASYIGATYETTFRMLSELINENVVVVSGKEIAIANEEKLLALTQAG